MKKLASQKRSSLRRRTKKFYNFDARKSPRKRLVSTDDLKAPPPAGIKSPRKNVKTPTKNAKSPMKTPRKVDKTPKKKTDVPFKTPKKEDKTPRKRALGT
jgi:hypothetical protein